MWRNTVVRSYGSTDPVPILASFLLSDWWHIRSVLRLGLKERSTTESDDMEEIIGDPVWKVEDRDLGMMDLGRDRVQEWYIHIYVQICSTRKAKRH